MASFGAALYDETRKPPSFQSVEAKAGLSHWLVLLVGVLHLFDHRLLLVAVRSKSTS